MSGWIKLYRKSFENPLYFSETFTRFQAWVDLLMLANHKESYFIKRGITVTVSVGQVGYDVDTLSKRWKWSRGKSERFLCMLEKEHQIARQKNNVTTLISIVNYEEYQIDDKANDNSNSKTNRKPKSKANSNANGHQTVTQTDTNKNDKNVNNEKNEEEPISSASPKKFNFRSSVIDQDVPIKLADEWMEVRKIKKSTNSETAFEDFMIEVRKTNLSVEQAVKTCVVNNWRGFKAKWITNENSNGKSTSGAAGGGEKRTADQKGEDLVAREMAILGLTPDVDRFGPAVDSDEDAGFADVVG